MEAGHPDDYEWLVQAEAYARHILSVRRFGHVGYVGDIWFDFRFNFFFDSMMHVDR